MIFAGLHYLSRPKRAIAPGAIIPNETWLTGNTVLLLFLAIIVIDYLNAIQKMFIKIFKHIDIYAICGEN